MFGALMFASDILMEVLPNIHLVGMFCVMLTAVFRVRALIPIYVYVALSGVFSGFDLWWIPYIYIWLPLWALAMLIPRSAPRWLRCVLYPLITGLHGFLFGALYAPAQALIFGLDFRGMIAWIIAGLPFDLIHALGNLAAGLLVYPLSELTATLLKRTRFYS